MAKNRSTKKPTKTISATERSTASPAKEAQSGMIRARISPGLKAEAEGILDQIGLSASDAIRMFYKQIAMRHGLPFEARIPNTTTSDALRDADAGRKLTRHVDVDDLFRKLGVKCGPSE